MDFVRRPPYHCLEEGGTMLAMDDVAKRVEVRADVALFGRTLDTALGLLTLVASTAGLAAVLWPDDRAKRVPLGLVVPDTGANPHLRAAADQLAAYFAGRLQRFEIALDLRSNTPFQREVWAALKMIPYGETRSYGGIAAAIRRPGASRAVGAANGRNPVSIIVPCHRVVGSGGGLTGFAGGLAAKRHLLALESGNERLL